MSATQKNQIEGIYPLTPLQEGMLFHKIVEEDSSDYVIQQLYDLKKKPDENALIQAMNLLLQRHNVLRTVIMYKKLSLPQQVVFRRREIEYESILLDVSDGEGIQREVNRILEEDKRRGFHLSKGSLIRIKCISTANGVYKMLWSFHHIIMDGWCIAILKEDFIRYYTALVEGKPFSFLESQVKREKEEVPEFVDYVKWLKKYDRKKGLEYWKQVLEGYEEPMGIRPMYKLSNVEQEMVRAKTSVPQSIYHKLQKVAVENCVTLNAVLETAWGLVLQEYNHTTDVVFGKVVSGRDVPIEGINGVVGLFVNTIPMRVTCGENVTIQEVLQAVMNQGMESSNYDCSSLAEVQQQSVCGNQLIQTLYAFENYYMGEEKEETVKPAIEMELSFVREQTNYPLTVSVNTLRDQLNLHILYNPNEYTDAEIGRVLTHYKQVLCQMAEDICMPVDGIALATEEEKQTILTTFNDTATEYERECSVVELLEEQVKKTPAHVAVRFQDEEITYEQLNARANQIACELRRMGVKRDDFVAIVAEKNVEMVAGICGILKAGGAYVPVDAAYPESRIQFILEDCAPKAVLYGEKPLQAEQPQYSLKEGVWAEEREENLERVNGPRDLAYLIYTSGTTGRPKGSQIEHRSIVRLVRNTNFLQLGEDRVILQTGSMAFDASTLEVWGALLNGGTLVLAEDDVITDSRRMKTVLAENKVNTMWMTSSLYNQMIQTDVHIFDGLQDLLIGGEKLSEDHVRMLKGHESGVRLTNGYGPTEGTTFTTTYEIPDDFDNIPIGKPIANTQVYIMNKGRLCGIGIPGELCIGGDGVARGYLNLPELTAEKFTKNPYGTGNLYHSGDLCRWLPDGTIDYMGRLDDQVKIRGFRIELGEIESSIRKLGNVKDCAVALQQDQSGEKAVSAYLVSEERLDMGQVRRQLGQVLPTYMLPTYLIQIEAIPLTRNGKLDRKALPAVTRGAGDMYEAPRTRMEEVLCGLYGEILGVERVGIQDDFFELGGHSLRATRLANRIEQVLGTRIGIKDIFSGRTPCGVAARMKERVQEEREPIPTAGEQEYYPLSSAQQQVFLACQMDPDGILYNMPQAIRLEGNVDVEAMERALQEVVRRHEILRTDFLIVDGKPVQKVRGDKQASFRYRKAGAIESDQEMMEQFVKPFHLEEDALVRMELIEGSDKWLLLLDIHHIVGDGMSMGIFMKELVTLYNGRQLDGEARQYRDYANWMKEQDFAKQRAYWTAQFKDEIPVLEMPLDYPRKSRQEHSGSLLLLEGGNELVEAVRKLSQKTGATEYMIYLAALMVVLGRYSRQEDVVVGSPMSGRIHRDTEQMLGMFVNTLALRGKPEKEKTFLQLLEEIKATCLDAYENQEYPLELLLDDLKVVRDMSRNPLFDVVLVLQNNEAISYDFRGAKAEAEGIHRRIAKFDLTFHIEQRGETYWYALEYANELYKEESALQLLKRYLYVLGELAAHPEQRLGGVEFCTNEERELILQKFNREVAEETDGSTLVDYFQEQVEKRGDHIAVVCKGELLTYRELNARANTLAYQLREAGVQPDDAVAILTEKSLEMVVGICGILKAGGAYVPIDSNYPQARRDFILQDCGCDFILVGTEDIETSCKKVFLSDLMNQEGKEENLAVVNERTDLAYIIYTSGTTGNPKGSAIEQKSILRLVKDAGFLDLEESRVILQTGSMAFDASTLEIWGALLNGGTLVIAGEEELLDVRNLRKTIQDNHVDTMWMTSTLFNQMIMEDISLFDGLKDLLIGGEKLSEEHVRLFKQHGNNVRLINGYGPTENTTFTTTYEIPSGFDSIPIGKPIHKTQVYIQSGDTLCGIGVPGELCIAGEGLARGYLNLPELTAEKFTDNPYGEGMLYHSGDLARWRSDGNIEYLGRIDEQVKIRGFRIELGEIEGTLRKVEGIQDCAVVIQTDRNGSKAVSAYYVSDNSMEAETIRTELGRTLPEYMIPSYWMQIEQIPVTMNGKLDRRKLPFIEAERSVCYQAPRTEEERLLCHIYEGILEVDRVGIGDGFFQLGGDSIKAIRIISKLREAGYQVTLKQVMEGKTPAVLARMIEKQESGSEQYHQGEVCGAVKTVPMLRQFLEWNLERPEHFNQGMLVSVGKATEAQVRKALKALVLHHDMLRAVLKDGSLCIRSSEEGDLFHLEVCSVETTGRAELEGICQRQQEAMDLAKGPLVRAVYCYGEEENFVFLIIHHIVVDSVSFGILADDFTAACRQQENQESVVLAKKTVSYQKWAEVLETQKGKAEKEKPYWDRVAERMEGIRYQAVRVRNDKTGHTAKEIFFDQDFTRELLERAGHPFHTTVEELLLSALVMAVCRTFQGNEAGIWLEGHGREELGTGLSTDRTVGWFTVMYPTVFQCGNTTEATIMQVKDTLRRVPGNGRGYSLLGNTSLKEQLVIGFNYHGVVQKEYNPYDLPKGDMIAPENSLPWDLSWNGSIQDGKLGFTVLYNQGALEEAEAERLFGAYKEALQGIQEYITETEGMQQTITDFSSHDLTQEELNYMQKVLGEDNLQDIYGLTPMQEGMLLCQQMDRETQSYIIQLEYQVEGAVNTVLLEEAFRLAICKNPVLRTAILYRNLTRPLQVVCKERKVDYETVKLQTEEEAVIARRKDLERNIDLEQDMLIRMKHFQLKEDRHILLLTFHHIILDGWCMNMVVGDILNYYEKLNGGSRAEVLRAEAKRSAEEKTPYSAYVKYLEESDNEEAVSYWEQQLEGCESMAWIQPAEKPEAATEQMRRQTVTVPDRVYEKLQDLMQKTETTCSTICETAWGIVLQQYCGTRDVVFGKVTSGRNVPIPEAEEMVGLFVNTIPVRIRREQKETVRELVEKQKKADTESEGHSNVSLAEIQGKTELGNDLIKTLYAFENYYVSSNYVKESEHALKAIPVYAREQTDYSLTLSVNTAGGQLHAGLLYNPNEYTDAEIGRVLTHYKQVLCQMAEDICMPVDGIALATEEEKQTILTTFNDTATEYAGLELSVNQILERQAVRLRDKVALVAGDRTLTYGIFAKKVNQLAYHIQKYLSGEEDFVAIVAYRSIEMMIGIYAAIRAGAAYVPIDPEYPKDRIDYILKDCKAKVVLTYQTKVQTDAVVMELEKAINEGDEGYPAQVKEAKDRVIYAIYTSGTTGNPKGVVNYQSGLLNLIYWMQSRYTLNEQDVILQKTAFCFDVSASEIFWFALAGASLVLPEPGVEKDPVRMSEVIREHGVTVINFVPSMLQLFLTTIKANQVLLKNLQSLRYVIAAGEALAADSANTLYELLDEVCKDVLLVNAYGPTEASIYSTYYDCHRGLEKMLIGKPISNSQIYIVAEGKLAGIGMLGELCIAGDGVAKGYINLPELTDEKFVENPFGAGRMYRSGDLARWMADGNIEYLGRMDEQVKIRGFRIELKEIERVLRSLEGVAECVVVAQVDETQDKVIGAYIVSEDETDFGKLRREMKTYLPEYMIPTYMMQIDTIPLTSNGKLDRKALPKMKGKVSTIFKAPETKVQKILCQIFEEVLGVQKIGIEDDFFELGGHSLRAARVVNQIQQVFGKRLTLKDIFVGKTIAYLSDKLETEKQKETNTIPVAKAKEVYEMSSVQKQIYLACQLDKEGILYNMPQAMVLEGDVQIDRMESVFQELVRRHEALRTAFIMLDGQPVQKIMEDRQGEFTYVEGKEEVSEKELMTAFIRPFDLGKDTLIRMELIKRCTGYILLLDLHHIIGDAMSIGILLEEFSALYHGERLEPLQRQYKDYSEWMRTRDLTSQKAYWKSQFSGEIPVLEMPLDYPRKNEQGHTGGMVSLWVEESLAAGVKKLAHTSGATDYMIFMASLMVLLSKYSHQEDIVVGSPISGRVHQETESMLGMFINTLAIRGKVEREMTFQQFLGEMKQTCLQAYENQEYPLEELIEEIALVRDLSRNPLFDVMFVVQNNEKISYELEEVEVKAVEFEVGASKFDLTFHVHYNEEAIEIGLEYCKELYTKDSAELFLQHYACILKQVIAMPEMQIQTIRTSSYEEEKQILEQFNAPIVPIAYRTVHGLLREQAERWNDKTAVVFQEKKISYQKLYCKAAKIAERLQRQGIQQNESVALLAPRSTEMIAAFFGIIMSGGVYVPIAPEAPEDRKQFILKDCKAKVVLTYQTDINTSLPVIKLEEESVDQEAYVENVNTPEDTAYIIYTSGSTGKPKGVMISHKALESLVDYLQNEIEVQYSDKVLMFANYVFDGSIWEMMMALSNGAELVIPDEDTVKDPQLMQKYLEEKRVTISYFPPAYYMQSQIANLKCVITAGSASNKELVERVVKDSDYINSYGPTETTVCATNWFLSKGESVPDTIPIGKPMKNKHIYIMNEGTLCGIKVPGELCIAGEGIAKGYLNDKALTKERFVEDPYTGGIMYRTGDLARWLPDGNIEYLGRKDEQIKIRGYRIELEEIRHSMLEIPSVKDCAVLCQENKYKDKALCAYYVSNVSITEEEIRNTLHEKLPEYMLPSYFIRVDEIPVNSSGKVDKKALQSHMVVVQNRRQVVAPRNEVESVLCKAFQDILEIAQVGITDGFFELGGDSIKAIRIISILRESGYEVTLKDIMRNRTPGVIAPYVKKIEDDVYEQTEVTGIIGKTPVMRQFDRWDFKNPSYFNQSMIIDVGDCDEALVRRVLDKIVAHHDMLRAVYKEGVLRICSYEESKKYDFVKISLQNTNQITDETNRISTRIQSSMDVENGPIVKAVLYQMEEGNSLFLCIHHIAVDAVSFQIIAEDIKQALQALQAGKEIQFPQKTASFKEWSACLADYAKTLKGTTVEKYWKEVERKIQHSGIPHDADGKLHEMKTEEFVLTEDITRKLTQEALQAYHTDVSDLLLSALGQAVQKLTGQKEIVICIEGHGRETLHKNINIDRTVGWFTSSYVTRIECEGTIGEYIISVKDTLHSIPNHGFECGLVLEDYTTDVYFNYFGELKGVTVGKISTGKYMDSNNRLPGNVHFNGSIVEKRLHMSISYYTDCYKETTIKRLVQWYQEELIHIIEHCVSQKESKKTITDMKAKELTVKDLNIINQLFDF